MGIDKGRRNQPDDGWDDDGWDLYDDGAAGHWLTDDEALWADAELDGQVRQRLATLVPLRHEAFGRWDELQPRMTRARRRRHAAQALATSVLVAAVALAGVQGATRFLPDDSSVVSAANGGDMATSDSQAPMVGVGQASSTIAGEGVEGKPSAGATATAPPGDDPSAGDEAGAPSDGSTTGAPGGDETTVAPGGSPGSSSAPVNGGSAASSVSIPPPASNTSPTTAATSSPTYRSTTTTTGPTTTTARATTTTTTTTVLTVRDLATVDVTIRGSEIRLVAVHNNAGVTSQVHNSGPEKIEITFRKGGEEHNLVATVRNGNVVTSIVDSGDD